MKAYKCEGLCDGTKHFLFLTLPHMFAYAQEFFDMIKAWVPALNCVPEFVQNFDYR